MASSNQTPDVLFSPIAANADASDINTIPQTYDPANYGYAAQNVGFPTECRLPVLNPDGTLGQGRAPRMQDWNGIMKLVSSHNFFLQNGGSYTFNPTVSSNIGGYPKNAVLWYFPENEAPCLVYSLINDNTNNFVDDPTLIDGSHWEMLVNPSSYANVALTNSPYTTNRILEIPQNIKLELNNGTLTLKAGSKVYVPNGFESDGVTPKFDVVTIESDLTHFFSGGTKRIGLVDNLQTSIQMPQPEAIVSGPTDTGSGTHFWYDTTNNLIKMYNNGTYTSGFSLPVGLFSVSDSSVTAIDQIFNGFGYIGSTAFMLPGVKVQLVWGRNADGTFHKTGDYYVSKKVLTLTRTSGALSDWILWVDCWDEEIQSFYYCRGFERVKSLPTSSISYTKIFNEEDGYYYYTSSGTTPTKNTVGGFPVVSNISCDANGKITSFTPCNVNTVNTYSRSELSGLGMPDTDNAQLVSNSFATSTNFTAPDNGWYCCRATSTTTSGNMMLFITAINSSGAVIPPYNGGTFPAISTDGTARQVLLPVNVGQRIQVQYSNASFSGDAYCGLWFIPAKGEN